MDIDGLSADTDSAIRGTFIGVPESSRKQTVRLCLGATSILAVVSLLLHEALTASLDAPPTGLVKNLAIIAFLITASITLFIRSRFPMAVLIIECAEVIGSLTLGFGTQTSAQALLITAIYACIRLPFAMQVTTDGIFTLFLFWQHFYAQSLHLAYPILFPLLAFVGIVSTSYDCVAEQRRTRSAINETQKRADGWEEQYLQAEKRSHIANELHDSIGHHLASIAALSQGAETLISKDKGAENDIRDALQEITAIAKGCLEETRAALRCLNMEDDSETIAHRSDAQGSVPPWQRLRDWGGHFAFAQSCKKLRGSCFIRGKRFQEPRSAQIGSLLRGDARSANQCLAARTPYVCHRYFMGPWCGCFNDCHRDRQWTNR